MELDAIIYLIVNAIRVGLAIYLLSIFLERRFSSWILAFLGAIVWAANSAAYILLNNNWLNLLTNLVGLSVAAFIFYKGSIINRLLTLILDIALGIAVENVALVMFRDYDPEIQIFTNIFSAFIFLIVVIIIDRTIKFHRNPGISISSSILMIVISIGLFFVGYVITYDTSLTYIELSLCIIMLINLSILYLYNRISTGYAAKRDSDLYKLQSEMYKRQLDVISKTSETTRILQHDMKHHIHMLQEYCSAGETERLKDYLNTISSSFDAPSSYKNTGNEVVNSILNYYSSCIKNIGGIIDCDVILHDHMEIDDFDLNTLLSNLLSNAYEALEKTENPYVKVNIRYNRGILNIEITNSYNGIVKKERGKYLTTKPNMADHGVGLISINRIVEKYNGYMELSPESDMFAVRIAIHA
ncbi:MAG: GHKL domain-containing protein [Lachnospiraceae bacterium]|nr:GHKL domain-containing protein [Lachnospiraceae bacterium]